MQAIVGFLAEVLAGIVLRHGLVLRWRVLRHEVAHVLVVPCVLACRYKKTYLVRWLSDTSNGTA